MIKELFNKMKRRMSIEEIVDRKIRLEREMADLLVEFERETKSDIMDLGMDMMSYQNEYEEKAKAITIHIILN